MKDLLLEIFKEELSEEILSFNEIKGYGSVNTIFDVEGKNGNYVIRLNKEDKELEYKKEKWCAEKIHELGIPTAEVLNIGKINQYCFTIHRKISGINGKDVELKERIFIWEELGNYASKYHKISEIEDEEIKRVAFHKNWKSRLAYNLNELNDGDSLLGDGILSKPEQKRAIELLKILEKKEFRMGLVHGDLSLRNTIINEDKVYLIDWGTAGVNIVPHNEIGILLMSNEATKEEFQIFLSNLGITSKDYRGIEEEINLLNFLHQLDKYRWAEGRGFSKINDYPLKVRRTFDKIN